MNDRPPATDDDGIERDNGPDRSDGNLGSNSLSDRLRGAVGRRTYLKAIGAYGAGRTLLGVSGRATAAEYTTYEVGAGETFVRRIDSNETFENALVDVSADGAGFDISASGRDWTIRNVGISGTSGPERNGSAFNLQVDEGSTARFENVYLGDGAIDGDNAGVFVPTSHAGTLRIRRCHVANWPDNGIYASAPGRNERDGRNGIVRITDSYAYNNNIAGFRLGTDGSSVERSVVHVDSDVPDNAASKENARGIWVKEGGSVRIENCDVLLEGPDGTVCIAESGEDSGGRARVVSSSIAAGAGTKRFKGNVSRKDIDSDPDVTLPSGVPESATAAARGESGGEAAGGSNASSATRTVEFVGGDSDDGEFINYEFETSGDLAGKKSVESGEEPVDGRVTGATGGWGDGFVTSGAIRSLEATLSGPQGQHRASVVITEEGDQSRIRFRGGNDQELLRYKLDVTGSVSATSSVEERGSVSGSRARGATGGAADELVFTGDIRLLRAALPPDGGRFLVKVKHGR